MLKRFALLSDLFRDDGHFCCPWRISTKLHHIANNVVCNELNNDFLLVFKFIMLAWPRGYTTSFMLNSSENEF